MTDFEEMDVSANASIIVMCVCGWKRDALRRDGVVIWDVCRNRLCLRRVLVPKESLPTLESLLSRGKQIPFGFVGGRGYLIEKIPNLRKPYRISDSWTSPASATSNREHYFTTLENALAKLREIFGAPETQADTGAE